MASVAGYTVTAWPRGRLETASRQVATLDPWPGTLGVAFVVGSHQAPPSECETAVDVSSVRSDAERLENLYKALVGAGGVTVVDSIGKTWLQVMVTRCATRIAWNGATSKFRLYAVWGFHPPSQATTA